MPYDIVDYILEYNKRSLSFKSDILNGLLGVLQVFELFNDNHAIRYYQGVPILTLIVDVNGLIIKGQRGLAEGLIMGLGVFTCHLSTKCSRFLSWSWTSWLGKVKSNYIDLKVYSFMNISTDFKVLVEYSNENIVPQDNFLQLDYKLSILSLYLHINAWTFQIFLLETLGNSKETNDLKLPAGLYLEYQDRNRVKTHHEITQHRQAYPSQSSILTSLLLQDLKIFKAQVLIPGNGD